jgi:hypothetical protein
MEKDGGLRAMDPTKGGQTMERFNDLRDRVLGGQYDVPARAVAEAILRHLRDQRASFANGWNGANMQEGS